MTPTPACNHPDGHLFAFVKNEIICHRGRMAKSRTIAGKYRCMRCLAPATGKPDGAEATPQPKRCLSCGCFQNSDGSLPCGH